MTKRVAIIAAVAENGVIGTGSRLPWHLPEDMAHFKRTTMGHAVIMGRRTYESIGRPLQGRTSIVLTREEGNSFPGCKTAYTIEDAIAIAHRAHDVAFAIGGASVYEAALPLASLFYITDVAGTWFGDVRFPSWDRSEWAVSNSRSTPKCTFTTLAKRSSARVMPVYEQGVAREAS